MNKAALLTWFCIAVIIGGGVYCLFALCQLTCLAALFGGLAFAVVLGVGLARSGLVRRTKGWD